MIKLVLFILLGAIVNAGVAWGSALWVDGMAPELFPHQQRGLTNEDHPRWRVLLTPGMSSTVVQSGATRNPYPRGPLPADATTEEIDAWLRGEAVRVPNDLVSVPDWSRASTPPTQSEYESPGVWEDARGWPMRSLVWHWVRRFSDGTDRRRWAIDLGGTQGPIGLPRALPLRPIPIGFFVDSLLYATCVWLMLSVPFDVRRMIRCKRGRCMKCGYDLSHAVHDVCPECGVSLSMPPALPGEQTGNR